MEKKYINYKKDKFLYYMFFSLIIIFLMLLISWFLWFFPYRDMVKSMLVSFSFIIFCFLPLVFSWTSLLIALFLFFLAKKNKNNNIFSLLSFALALIIIITSLFLYFNIKVSSFLVVFLPWIFAIIAAIFLLVSSAFNLVVVKNDFNQKQEKITLAANQIKNNKISSDVLINKRNVNSNNLDNDTRIPKTVLNTVDKVTKSSYSTENLNIEKFIDKSDKEEKTLITNWTKKQIKQIWEKGIIIEGVNKDLYRKDYAGAWMFFSDFILNPYEAIFNVHGYSWTIVNHKPFSQNGTNDEANLRPLNVVNALTKGEDYPKWKTRISSRGNENIIKEQIWSE